MAGKSLSTSPPGRKTDGDGRMTYRECYAYGVAALSEASVPEAELDARLLLEFVCRTDYNMLLTHGDSPVEEDAQTRYRELIDARSRRIPLQQLTQEQYFCGFPFYVNEYVLIPRQDTEILVEEALTKLAPGDRLLDLCTGSGCVLISLLKMGKELSGTGADISEEALAVARENGSRLLKRQPEWYLGDLFAALPDGCAPFDVIVSNPPYIKSSEIDGLMPEVKEHEPRLALDGSADGLCFYRRLAAESPGYLKAGGWVVMEIGYDQGEALRELLSQAGFSEVCIRKDYAGLDRVALGRWL